MKEEGSLLTSLVRLAGEALTSDVPTEIRREDTMRMGFRAPIQPIYMAEVGKRKPLYTGSLSSVVGRVYAMEDLDNFPFLRIRHGAVKTRIASLLPPG